MIFFVFFAKLLIAPMDQAVQFVCANSVDWHVLPHTLDKEIGDIFEINNFWLCTIFFTMRMPFSVKWYAF